MPFTYSVLSVAIGDPVVDLLLSVLVADDVSQFEHGSRVVILSVVVLV